MNIKDLVLALKHYDNDFCTKLVEKKIVLFVAEIKPILRKNN